MSVRLLPVAAFLLALVAAPAVAQDAPGGEGAPGAAAPEAGDPAALEGRIADLASRVAGPPPAIAPGADAETRTAYAKAVKAYDAALAAMSEAAGEYAKAGGTDPRTLWHCGYALARRGDRLPKADAAPERRRAADILARAVAGAPAEAGFRADAEYWLGRTRLFLVDEGGATVADAIASLRAATLAFRKAERPEDAGRAASDALRKLVSSKMDAEAREFTKAVDALGADFGALTETVRGLARRAATGVGERLPDLPDAKDAEGKPVVWKDLRGAPLLIHFFHAGWPTGRSADERDVETVLRPLWDRLGTKGLRIVGVSMDLALSKEQADAIRKNWEEWGIKNPLQDGSLPAVRTYAERQGIAWPWIWDGLWTKNPVSAALGGAGANAAHAILVDAGGVIRWRGDAPFAGLPEACDALVK